jgi:hypothetical protein
MLTEAAIILTLPLEPQEDAGLLAVARAKRVGSRYDGYFGDRSALVVEFQSRQDRLPIRRVAF